MMCNGPLHPLPSRIVVQGCHTCKTRRFIVHPLLCEHPVVICSVRTLSQAICLGETGQWHCLKVEVGLPCFFNEEQHGKADGNLMTIGVPCTLKVPGNYALDGTPVKLMRMHLSEAWLNSEYGGRPADWIGIGWIDMDRGSHTCLTRTLTPFAHPGRQYHDVWCMIPPCGHNMF